MNPRTVSSAPSIVTGSLALVLCALPGTTAAQTKMAVVPHGGSLGLGVDFAVAISERVSFRGGANFQPYVVESEISDADFELDLPTPSFMATVDLHPGGSGFRFSAGALYFGSDLEMDAILDEDIEIGNGEYTPADVGTLSGTLVTNALAPYLGIGVGNVWSGSSGFSFDFGFAFHGTPAVELTASGPIASDPAFQADLDLELAQIEDDVSKVKAYPVLSFGAHIAVGGR